MPNKDLAIAFQGVTADPWLYVAEIEHRIANEYALAVASVSLAASQSPSGEAKAALAGVAQRLRDYAAAHRALQAPVSNGLVDLSEYLRSLCGALAQASLNERGISLTLVEQSVDITAERCWRVGLIVSELVTNSIRHGFRDWSGAITVEIARSADHIVCRVSDNGRAAGIARPGRGAELVDALARDLGGTVERDFHIYGVSVVLSFPERIHGAGDAKILAASEATQARLFG
jgi:two-component sensor histidine kinase